MKEKEVNLTSSQKIENKLNSFIGKHAKLIVAIFVAIVVVVIAVDFDNNCLFVNLVVCLKKNLPHMG